MNLRPTGYELRSGCGVAPLRAFVSFLLGVGVLFVPVCSNGSVQPEPRIGHGLGSDKRAFAADQISSAKY